MRRWAARALAVLLLAATAAGAVPPPDPLLGRALALVREHPAVWTGAAAITRGDRVVVVGGGSALRAELVDLAERARRTVARVWGTVDAIVLVPSTTARAAVLAAPADVRGLAALAGDGHVIVEPAGFARLSAAGRRVVLTHELTHVATGAAVDHDTPRWLVEGFADYVGFRDSGIPVPVAAAELAAEVRAGRLPDALPGPSDFDLGPRRVRAYQEAWLACRYVAARFGENRLVDLYRYMRLRPRDADAVLRQVLGMGSAEFTAAWREYLRRELT
ncbi:hypothetical protein AB0K60_10315 [Thermopolyspora sp. NPDC052614]|uniref:hypothetical protein n=1 Tax=Thermopolyspora sp. NPDC052614 TaxID=3155682 RepID=UPI00342C0350